MKTQFMSLSHELILQLSEAQATSQLAERAVEEIEEAQCHSLMILFWKHFRTVDTVRAAFELQQNARWRLMGWNEAPENEITESIVENAIAEGIPILLIYQAIRRAYQRRFYDQDYIDSNTKLPDLC